MKHGKNASKNLNVLVAPISSLKKIRGQTTSVPWLILDEALAGGAHILDVCFVEDRAYNFCARLVTTGKPRKNEK